MLFACLLRRDPTDVVTPVRLRRPGRRGRGPPLAAFPAAYEAWCARRGVVSSFVVFHPLLAQRRLARARASAGPPLGRHGRLAARARRPDRRRCTSTTAGSSGARRRAGSTSRSSRAPADLDEFVAVYEQTMRAGGRGAVLLLPAGVLGRAGARRAARARRRARRRTSSLASVLGMGRAAVAALPPRRRHRRGARHGREPPRALGARALGARARLRRRCTSAAASAAATTRCSSSSCASRPDGLVAVAIGKAVHDVPAYLRAAAAPRRSTGTASSPPTASPADRRLTGSRSRRASAKRSSRPRSCTSRRRTKLTLRISSLWQWNQRAWRGGHRRRLRGAGVVAELARARRPRARRRCAGRAGSSPAASARPRSVLMPSKSVGNQAAWSGTIRAGSTCSSASMSSS